MVPAVRPVEIVAFVEFPIFIFFNFLGNIFNFIHRIGRCNENTIKQKERKNTYLVTMYKRHCQKHRTVFYIPTGF